MNLVNLGDGAVVDAARWLVEHDDARVLNVRLGDDDLLLVSTRQLDARAFALIERIESAFVQLAARARTLRRLPSQELPLLAASAPM